MTATDPFQVAYQAIVNLPATTGMAKAKRADVHGHAAVKALASAGLLSDEGHLRVITAGHNAERRRTCPTCGNDLGRVAMVDIAHTFEKCDCGTPGYAHLVEQLWHREHVGPALTAAGRVVLDAHPEERP